MAGEEHPVAPRSRARYDPTAAHAERRIERRIEGGLAVKYSNQFGVGVAGFGALCAIAAIIWGLAGGFKSAPLWPLLLLGAGVLLIVIGSFARISGVVLAIGGIVTILVGGILLYQWFKLPKAQSQEQQKANAIAFLIRAGLVLGGGAALLLGGRLCMTEEQEKEMQQEAGRRAAAENAAGEAELEAAAEAAAAAAVRSAPAGRKSSSSLTCDICDRECVAFGRHGLLTSFSKPLAKYCPMCRIWVCGHCMAWGGKCPRCKCVMHGV